MSKIIPYGKQDIDQDDINAVVDVLKSDFLTQGPKVKEFEEKFAEYVGAKYAELLPMALRRAFMQSCCRHA